MSSKSIDINQRIPLHTLEASLFAFLKDAYSNDYVLEQLAIEFSGENRLKKALRIVNKIILNNPLNLWLLENRTAIKQALKSKDDRNVILISLLNSAFPFSFDMFSTLGKYFTVQEVVSRDAVTKGISKLYGSNRAMPNAIDSVIPMYFEAKFFERPKVGLYEFTGPKIPQYGITRKLFRESYIVNKGLKNIEDFESIDPYFVFVE